MLIAALLLACLGAVNSDHIQNEVSTEAITLSPAYYEDPLNMPNPYSVPKYRESLENFNLFLGDIRSRISNASKNLLILAGIIIGLSKEMTYRPWKNYDEVYESEVPLLFELVQGNPSSVVDEVNCLLSHNEDAIAGLQNIMTSSLVQDYCESNPTECDNFIQEIIRSQTRENLIQESELLTALGNFSQTYIEFMPYLKIQERADLLSLYVWIVKHRHILEPLVRAGSTVRYLSPSRCSEQARFPEYPELRSWTSIQSPIRTVIAYHPVPTLTTHHIRTPHRFYYL